ncbi:MAG: molybdate transport system ATP-binding protein [Acidobacteriota bacterium]
MISLDVLLRQGSFTLEIRARFDARITALFGPSGAGKTTVLDTIAGLRRPSSGSIRLGSRVLYDSAAGIDLPPRHRHIGYVAQDVALFPHMSVERNVLYGRRAGQRLSLETVTTMLEIAPLLGRRVPQLSGGERQRVALARALMSAPELLLLDEPLTAVDVERRRRILPYLERVRDELRVPIIYVTHDVSEVRQLAEHVVVLENGRVIGEGPAGTALLS